MATLPQPPGTDAGGLALATRLGDTLGRKGLAHVTLIERSRSHFRKPHLHEVEGLFARTMYLSLFKMHQVALHGWWKTALGSASRLLGRSTEPGVKLH